MGLRERVWPRFLKGPDPRLVTELYEPALREAVSYDRCCAYFSSSVLAAAARGFAPFVDRLLAITPSPSAPPVRLLVNEELSQDDVDAMLYGHGADALAERLSRGLVEPRDALEAERLALLGLLVQRGLLEVRVGVLRSGRGILHAKFGLVADAAGDTLVFSGSSNESASGLTQNFESLELSGSWDDGERFEHYRLEFETMWNGNDPQLAVIALPEAVRQNLIRYAEPSADQPAMVPTGPQMPVPLTGRPRDEAAMRWRFAIEAPWFPDGGRNCDAMAPDVALWPHQMRVVEESAEAWPAGRLLCDEVGMGKTVEAIMVLRRLLAGRGVRRALLLVPAGIVGQWQGELREKGGLLVPRLEGQSTLVWPDGRVQQRDSFADALREPVLLVSRELARLEQNAEVLMQAPRWDLVLLDEAHAARRASQVETEYNSATLLLGLLRSLQLRGQARSLLLLSATPMQTQPWEPWDLLGVLGEGAPWMADFRVVRDFYGALDVAEKGPLPLEKGRVVSAIVGMDSSFPALPAEPEHLPTKLFVAPGAERGRITRALRDGAPLGRRMHRNTRATLRTYFAMGLIDRPPADRAIQDVSYDFATVEEREVYDGVQTYVERRFAQLEAERPGKGFVMTVYRRRAASSPMALERSLERRRHGLELVIKGAAASQVDEIEASDQQDLDELIGAERTMRLPSSLPEDPVVARSELRDVTRLLERLRALQGRDSKLEHFARALDLATDDGRPCLVFSEFTDTVSYLRDALVPRYGSALACYTGEGGTVREDGKWVQVSKATITERLAQGNIRVLLCSDAASEGLNLQSASALINYDLPWNPARVEQRIGRIDRIGQKAGVLRIVNLVLKDSVDERVYTVLGQRCDLFRTFVGTMQPVLSVARRMLLGIEPFSSEALNAEVDRAKADHLAAAAFSTNELPPPPAFPPGVTIHDLARAFSGIRAHGEVETPNGRRRAVVTARELAGSTETLPLSPFDPVFRRLQPIGEGSGDLLPLVVAVVEQDAFRVAVAAWASVEGPELLDRAERLEALLGQWNGQPVSDKDWQAAHAAARSRASELVAAMARRALGEERAGLERQVQAASVRLRREVGRFLACARDAGQDYNAAFHRWMQRGGQVAALLAQAHDLIGYPEWSDAEIADAERAALSLSANQRKNVLLATPLEAAIKDPRWMARSTLARLPLVSTVGAT